MGSHRNNEIVCTCSRRQTIVARVGDPSGCTLEKARQLGWVEKDPGAWQCPRCSGNLEELEKAFAPPVIEPLPQEKGEAFIVTEDDVVEVDASVLASALGKK